MAGSISKLYIIRKKEKEKKKKKTQHIQLLYVSIFFEITKPLGQWPLTCSWSFVGPDGSGESEVGGWTIRKKLDVFQFYEAASPVPVLVV